jgi:hypothetical protein
MAHGRYFDCLLLKTELSVIYTRVEFLRNNNADFK